MVGRWGGWLGGECVCVSACVWVDGGGGGGGCVAGWGAVRWGRVVEVLGEGVVR